MNNSNEPQKPNDNKKSCSKINKKKIVSYVFMLFSMALSIVAFFILPSRVTVNISFSGEFTFMSKYLALAFPFFVTSISSWVYANYENLFKVTATEEKQTKESWKKQKGKNGAKYLVFSVLGIILTLWVIFKNI